jgi:hypothetical protein
VGPGHLGPAGMQSLHLQIDRDHSPSATAKAAGLSELAAQFTIGAFEQGRGAHELASDATQGIEGDRLLKVTLQCRHCFWCLLPLGAYKATQAFVRLGWRLGLINGTGLLKQLLT